MGKDRFDPKGLIAESYKIEGIGAPECRSIFLDWALSLGGDIDPKDALPTLISAYARSEPDHPMSAVLEQGLVQMQAPKRRGGWRARQRN
ncbi:hypothetical protein BXY66_1780 [Shimia isoporae]|uniref:Uncharacterized protein n=1 Tax=Shimia isoporae TaxID=647720 RepID=A0A4R1NSG6_9RHOB|nr:hypothetical protein [Shimia isoporae]TCL09723.1 hypothetical protein BXY66_1780 [Shimia isoporae]